MSALLPIDIPHEAVAEFCKRHHVCKMAVFGSALRDDFRADSDIDVLVEFHPGKTPGLAFFGMQEELADLLGRTVDLNTPECFNLDTRSAILREAWVIHEGA